jgi:hypothetical protein
LYAGFQDISGAKWEESVHLGIVQLLRTDLAKTGKDAGGTQIEEGTSNLMHLDSTVTAFRMSARYE